MAEFWVWVVLVTDAANDRLISGLARKGYGVGPLAESQKIAELGQLSCITALRLSWSGADRDVTDVSKEVKALLADIPASHHGVIVSLPGRVTWSPSNIKLPEKPPDEAPTVYDRLNADDTEPKSGVEEAHDKD